MPFSMAVVRLQVPSVGTPESPALWTGWDSRVCARTGGAGPEAYKDIMWSKSRIS